MNLSIGKKIVMSFFVVTACFVIMLYAFYYSTKKMKATAENEKKSQETLLICEQILTNSISIGYSSREYILTGNETLLEPFERAVDDVERLLLQIRLLTNASPAQQKRIDELEALTKERIAFAQKTIATRKQMGMSEAISVINTGEGRRITEATRGLLKDISETQLQQLVLDEAESESTMSYFETVLITLILFIDTILILVGIMIFQNQKMRQQYEDELLKSNTELESFSYMVSHDLRSPVRTLLGLIDVTKKKYQPEFEPELKELFGYMESKSQRMNDIIEDLLILAKYGREKVKPVPADMSVLFTQVWDNICHSMPHTAKLKMAHLPVVEADVSMMEQVFINLCSNAVKYSARKENPVVEVGYTQENNSTTFFVKDNGAGFDMKDYSRLFNAFQRLHHSSEYEGTGVGLLLVKRIIEMHQGKIWAESKPNEGATFYFTLPAKAA